MAGDPRALTDDEIRTILNDQMSRTSRGAEPYRVEPLHGDSVSPQAAESAAFEEPNDPLIGAGKWMNDRIRGVEQGFLKLADTARPGDPKIREAIAGFDASHDYDADRAYDAYAAENPFATGVGEALPTLGLSGGLFSLPLKAAGLGFLKEGSLDQRLMGAGVEAASAGTGNLLGRAAGGYVNPELSAVKRETLREGRARDIHPRLSQVTGSPTIERFEDWSSRMPFGAGIMDDFTQANQRGFNTTAAESMGQNVDSAGQVGPEVFARAQREMRGVFSEVDRLPNVTAPRPGASPPVPYTGVPVSSGTAYNGPPIRLEPQVAQAATEALRLQTLQLTPDPTLTRIANDALYAVQNGGAMTGEAYQRLYSELTNASHAAFGNGDPTSGRAFGMLRDALDQSADSSLRRMGRGDLADRLQAVRQQYGNFKILEGGRVAEGGNVNPARVAQAIRTNNPDAFRTGRNTGQPLDFLGRWAELFPGLRAGSQTAERQAVQETVTNPGTTATVLAPAAAGIAKFTTSPVVTAIPARIGGTAAGHAAELAIEPTVAGSVQSFMRRILRPVTPNEAR